MCQTEQQAAQGFELKIKEECDSFAEDISKIGADKNFESDQPLEQQRKELSEKIDIFMVKIEVV